MHEKSEFTIAGANHPALPDSLRGTSVQYDMVRTGDTMRMTATFAATLGAEEVTSIMGRAATGKRPRL